ncbi:MAG: cob(I)yrinic acid a,c-diamide adenosyltransferase [Coriobacteriia bacterium]|nr:cob(I)yrinic acid a,c-diamide adenosyltransferase [Coriobacteriia bacterium]
MSDEARVRAGSEHAGRVGLVQVYTGDGKGKTTAAVGLAVRAAGAGLRVAFVQFVKGGERSSELPMLERLGVRVERPARASTGLLAGGATDEDRRAAAETLAIAQDAIAGGAYDLVVLDEACVAAAYGLVDEVHLLAALRGRPVHVEVVLTGRGATDALLEAADLVTEMRAVRHPFDRGVKARKGIEF